MKKLFALIIIYCSSSWLLYAASDSLMVKSTIKTVTLFMNGANLKREFSANVSSGRHTIVLKDLSSKIIARNVQVSVVPDIKILSISDRKSTQSYDKKNNEIIAKKKDSIKTLNNKIALLENEETAYDAELKLLLKNDELSSKEKSITVEELTKAADFYRTRIKEIHDKKHNVIVQMDKLSSDISLIQKRLRSLIKEKTLISSEIIIEVEATNAALYNFNINYLVADAGWQAAYDIKATDIDKGILFDYNAKVYNNTGVDWSDVNIVLSTADPTQSASRPELTAWTLNFYNNYGNEGYIQNKMYGEYAKGEKLGGGDFEASATYSPDEFNVSELSAEFEIDHPYSIPSNAKPYLIDVKEYELPATYKHIAVPKMDRDAFLLARISGWEDLDIIDGPANIYFGNTYIGQSYINTRFVEDTLDLSLGRDKKLLVTRAKKKDFSSKKIIGQNKKEMFTFEIIVKNNRKSPVTIELLDQIPVSQESDIEVSIIDISQAELDELSGKLTWNLTLNPGESRKYTISFSVKYPKNHTVKTRKTRQISNPSFF